MSRFCTSNCALLAATVSVVIVFVLLCEVISGVVVA
jgi:hypothetical protein